MLTGVPMQLMTAHRCTASHSRCTSPSGQPAQDLTLHGLTVSTENVVGCDAYVSATAPDMRAWESQPVLCSGGAPMNATYAPSESTMQFCESTCPVDSRVSAPGVSGRE